MVAELYHTLGAGMDTIESVPAALALVECAQGDPRHCAVLAANLGGDTDTIGAMATAVCGAARSGGDTGRMAGAHPASEWSRFRILRADFKRIAFQGVKG